MFGFLKKSKTNDSASINGSHNSSTPQHLASSFLHRRKTSTSTNTKFETNAEGTDTDSLKPRSKSFNISRLFLNELQESHENTEGKRRDSYTSNALSFSDDDSSSEFNRVPGQKLRANSTTSGIDLNLSLSRFTSINQDKFASQLLSLLHSKGLSNPFIISENKELKLSFSSNGEYIFLPSMQDNEEDESEHINNDDDSDPVVFNFAVILSLEKDTEIDIKAGFLSSVADINWTKGIPNNRVIRNEMFELGHLDLNMTSDSMNYQVSAQDGLVSELDNDIVSKSYKFKKISDVSEEPYFDSQNEFKFYNRHKVNPKLFKAGDYVFFNSVLISPSITESLNTLNTHICHHFKIFINDHCYRHELKMIRGPPLAGISSNDKPLYINKTWNDSLSYELTLPKKFVTIGDELPVKMKFAPLQKGIILKRIKVNILETLSYSSKDLKYETEDREYAIQEKYITGNNVTEENFKVAPLLEIKANPQRNSQSLREVVLKPNHLLNTDNLLESCYEMDSHLRDSMIQIASPLRILSYLSFQNKENISKFTNKETKMVSDNFNLDIKTRYNDFKHRLHPDSANSKFIRISHKFQISLRVSKLNQEDNKYHHYEVVIDTPIYLLDSNCTGSNLILPSYNDSTGTTNNVLLNSFLDDFEINMDPGDKQNQLPSFEQATSPFNSPALIPMCYTTSSELNTNALSRTSTIGTTTLERYRSNIDDMLLSPPALGIANNNSGNAFPTSRRGSRVSANILEPFEEDETGAEVPPPPEYSEYAESQPNDERESVASSTSSQNIESTSIKICISSPNTSEDIGMNFPGTAKNGNVVRDTTNKEPGADFDRESIDLTEQFSKAVFDGVGKSLLGPNSVSGAR